MKGTCILAVLILTGMVASSWGQVDPMQWRGRASANGNLVLRSSPPTGLFYLPGNEVGNVVQGDRLIVEDQKTVVTLFGTQEWLKVRRLPKSTGTPSDLTGWVYNGTTKLPDGTVKPYVASVPMAAPPSSNPPQK